MNAQNNLQQTMKAIKENYEAWDIAGIAVCPESDYERAVLLEVVNAVPALLSALEEQQRENEKLTGIQETMEEAISAIISEGRREKLKSDEWMESVVNEARKLRIEHAAMKEALEFYAAESTYDIDHLDKHGYIIIDDDGGDKARDALAILRKEGT